VVGCYKNCNEHSFDSEELLGGYQFFKRVLFYAFPVEAGFDNPSCKYKASPVSKQCWLTVTNQ